MRQSHNIVERGLGWLFDTPTFVPFLVAAVVVIAYVIWLWRADRREGSPATPSVTVNELKREIAEQVDAVYQATRARDEARTERDACKKELLDVTNQRDAAQSESRAIVRNIDDTMMPKTVVEGLVKERDALRVEAMMLRNIAPLARLYRRALALGDQLAQFREELERQEENLHASDPVAEWMKNTPVTQARFIAEYQPQLVTFSQEMKQHGWVIPELTDEKLARDVYGSGGLEGVIIGVAEAKERIGAALLATASKLNV